MRIITFVGSTIEYNFYIRLAEAVKLLGHSVVFLTPKLSLYLSAKLNGFSCHLIHNSANTTISEDFLQTSEVAGKIDDIKSAAVFYSAVKETAEKIHKTQKIDVAAVWNGSSIPTKALVQFAHHNGIKTLFFELANIPGKLFVDPVGVNAQSLLYSSPNVLERYGDNDIKRYEEWKETYIQQKKKELTTATAQYHNKINNALFLLDAIGVRLMNLPSVGNMNILSKLREKVFRRKYELIGDQYDLKNRKYIFYPMQVSMDSQLLFNSSIDNIEGIKYCIKKGLESKLDVVVKPHPAENNEVIHNQLRNLQRSYPFIIVQEPTMKILEHASEVITINSTVGLEAMIIGKKVTFLGKTFYSSFTEQSIKRYIMGYLIDADYYSSEIISLTNAKKIIERIDLK